MEDQKEVGSLSRRTQSPYPPYYGAALACSLLLYPHRHCRALRPFYPRGDDTGLPCSVLMTLWFRPSLQHRQRLFSHDVIEWIFRTRCVRSLTEPLASSL